MLSAATLDSYSRYPAPTGLDEYKPAESKSPRGLTRFPNRNKFISEYIYKKTGETRTAKQVGSRIQQLRDTAAGKPSEFAHILALYLTSAVWY